MGADLFHGRGLLFADDAGADVRGASGDHRIAAWVPVLISLLPILKDWDENFGLTNTKLARRRNHGWRRWGGVRPRRKLMVHFWLHGGGARRWPIGPASPAWPASSHEALDGIEQSARFFTAADPETARALLDAKKVAWVPTCDADRTVANSALIVDVPASENSLGPVLDRAPSQAPAFLHPVAQNAVCKLFAPISFRKKRIFHANQLTGRGALTILAPC